MNPSSHHVLIVEDEQHLSDVLKFNLEAEGYGVSVADTGEAALDLLLGSSRTAFERSCRHVISPTFDV